MRAAVVISAVLLTASLVMGCSHGVTHVVGAGENLYRIGLAYGQPYRELGRINGLSEPYRLARGDRIFVPGAERPLPVAIITPTKADPSKPLPAARAEAPGLQWPVMGRVAESFGGTGEVHHDGIDILAREGSLVRAAMGGKVIFAAELMGYGNVVIVEHQGGLTTVYAHNELNLVAAGDQVGRGQELATVGSSGRLAGPGSTAHLHFEVRKENIARDPAYFLPPI